MVRANGLKEEPAFTWMKTGRYGRGVPAALALLFLFACSVPLPAQDTNSGDQADIGGDATHPRLRALVHGPVKSAVYRHLRSQLAISKDDGDENPANYDLLIFDGRAVASQSESGNLQNEISDALRQGKWVLALDVTRDQKKDLIGPTINFATEGESRSYLVHSVVEIDGSSAWRIVASDYSDDSDDPGLTPEYEIVASDAREILSILEDPNSSYAPSAQPDAQVSGDVIPANDSPNPLPPDTPIPSDLVHTRWYYTYDPGPRSLWQPARRPNAAKQFYRILVNYTITAFLNNKANASGDFQFVLTQIDGSLNPTNGTNYFANMTTEERAWFPDQILLTMRPSEDAKFSWVSNAPQTPNPTATYSNNSTFMIGFSGKSPEASYTWSTTKTYEIPDWKVSSNGSGNNMSWNFRSKNPDADIDPYDCGPGEHWFNVCGAFDNGYPNSDTVPNALSSQQNIFHASVVYRTQTVLTSWQQLLSDVDVRWVDLWCEYPAGLVCGGRKYSRSLIRYPSGPFINLAAVVPVPIKNITFSQNPDVAGRPVTGQVFLASPAPIDTAVSLSSNSTNATVLPNLTIKSGENNGQFQVLTSSNGGPSGSINTATITAFYAQNFQEQLLLRNYGAGDLLPPASYPTTDYRHWAQVVPIGKWVPGYKVRYAVTFVDINGKETDRGPWTPWFSNDGYALPLLFNIPIDSTNRAVARKVYRQFYSDVVNGDLQAGVQSVGQLNDNKTTMLQDQYAN